MSAIKHIWWAIRFGDWSAGYDKDWGSKPGEPLFYCRPVYYDGHHFYVRIWKLWAGVSY